MNNLRSRSLDGSYWNSAWTTHLGPPAGCNIHTASANLSGALSSAGIGSMCTSLSPGKASRSRSPGQRAATAFKAKSQIPKLFLLESL